MTTIIFESHGATFDNENHLSSGWFDVELSELGKKQAAELGARYKDDPAERYFIWLRQFGINFSRHPSTPTKIVKIKRLKTKIPKKGS